MPEKNVVANEEAATEESIAAPQSATEFLTEELTKIEEGNADETSTETDDGKEA